MKASLIPFLTLLLCLISGNSWGQTEIEINSENLSNNSNICRDFARQQDPLDYHDTAPAPVRTLPPPDSNKLNLSVDEELFYRELGLTPSREGGYICLATDPENERREFTIFKVQKIDKLLVATAFLEDGNFLTGQEQATTDLFLKIMQFYTDIPEEYYPGVNNYLTEFYSRMADGSLKPDRDRVYPLDEPSQTMILYHSLQGKITGTAISLNIPL